MTGSAITCSLYQCEVCLETFERRTHHTAHMVKEHDDATENVISITALDKANLDALLAEVSDPDEFRVVPGTTRTLIEVGHQHGPYGWRGCRSCRHMAAEDVAERFRPQ